jgi:hypothetical protein
LNFQHVSNLTDLTGIMQHALFDLPNRKEGYCIDDNARAVLLAVLSAKVKGKHAIAPLLPIYLSFIHYMQTRSGYFMNFMSYSKMTHEERGSEDSFGRTMMALGFLINESTNPLLVRTGREIFSKAYPNVNHLVSLRGIANTVIGICQYIKYAYPDDLKRNMVQQLTNKLVDAYKHNSTENWRWFEPVLTYDNAMLPLALLNAYEVTQDETYFNIAFDAMSFLESKVFFDDILRPVGNNGWYACNGNCARYDQQGIDVMAMVLFYSQAFRITREQKWLDRMYTSYQWFLGVNDLGLPLYDPSTGGCADGLHSEGINLNQGAESTLAYWISHVVVDAALSE